MNEQALKERLKTISHERNIHFNECWKKLILERFLVRLSHSAQMSKFIFKGGFLLGYMMQIGRETTDIDFLLTDITPSEDEIKLEIQQVISTDLNDGFTFSYDQIELLEQPHMNCPGYRISLRVVFGHMKDKIQIDVGVGDIVKAINRDFHLFQYKGKPLFENEISLLVYPPETIFAEKLETIISKGTANSRMKDYHDLFLLTQNPQLINPKTLKASLKSTFNYRGTTFDLIKFDDQGLTSLQRLWTAHLKNLGNIAQELNMPKEIHELITSINDVLYKIKQES